MPQLSASPASKRPAGPAGERTGIMPGSERVGASSSAIVWDSPGRLRCALSISPYLVVILLQNRILQVLFIVGKDPKRDKPGRSGARVFHSRTRRLPGARCGSHKG